MTTVKPHSPDEIVQTLRAHIAHEYAYDRPDPVLADDFKLIEARVIDSMAIFQLVSFIETEFGITWEPEELVLRNFETIANLAAFILSKQNGSRP